MQRCWTTNNAMVMHQRRRLRPMDRQPRPSQPPPHLRHLPRQSTGLQPRSPATTQRTPPVMVAVKAMCLKHNIEALRIARKCPSALCERWARKKASCRCPLPLSPRPAFWISSETYGSSFKSLCSASCCCRRSFTSGTSGLRWGESRTHGRRCRTTLATSTWCTPLLPSLHPHWGY